MQLEIWEILTRIEALQFNLILEHHYSREKVLQSMCCSPLVWRPLSRHSMGTWPILERLAKSANWEHHRLLYWYVSTATQHSGTSVDVKIWWFGLLNEYPWVTHTDSHRKGVRRNNFNSMVGLEDKSAVSTEHCNLVRTALDNINRHSTINQCSTQHFIFFTWKLAPP